MDALSTTAQDDSSGANPSSVKSDDSSPQRESGSSSPPPNCAICLGTCKNKSFTDSCLHQFCFSCLLTWSKVKAECPLCKQAFRSIIHNVRSNHQYEEYLVVQRQTEESNSRIDIDRVTAATHRFRYRTTLTLPRRESIAIQQLLRHYPFMADVFPPPARAPPARRRREPASFRRTVYRHNLWARPLPDFTGRFRDCSPEFYRYNNTQMHRLVPWLNRELHYLLNENAGHISYVLSRIIELLPQHHINSREFRDAVARYFGERTDHFLHELYCFASTPYDMAGYDRNVQYTTDTRISTMINEVISSSDSDSVDSDIVVVSSSAPAEPPPGPSRVPPPVYPQGYIAPPPADRVIPIETISHSDTDDDSSEVMVVGYIKPPQDRTPEIVDLLGSDSDVIVQDAPPEPAPAAAAGSGAGTAAPAAVKLTLKRARPRPSSASSDSDSTFVPSPARRRRSAASTTSAASRSTPGDTARDPPRIWTPLYLQTSSSSTSASASASATSTSSSDDEPRARSKPRRRAARTARRADKRPPRRRSRPARPARPAPGADRRQGRKSHSGKGVKSSSKTAERAPEPPDRTPPPPEPALDQPGPAPAPPGPASTQPGPAQAEPAQAGPSAAPGTSSSGAGGSSQRRKSTRERSRRRRRSRETRRLRSVVNVMYNSHRNTDESNSSANYSSMSSAARPGASLTPPHSAPRRAAPSSSDSEDDLPLNLTLHKLHPPPT